MRQLKQCNDEFQISINAAMIASRKSRYGHYPHLVWIGKDGQHRTARLSVLSLKAAMLATGTQGTFTLYTRGTGMMSDWSLACMWLRHLKRGTFYW